MLWTKKTEQALNLATKLHDGQYRKGPGKLPFVTHTIAVASIVSRYTDDEDVVAAALMHDLIEDTLYTKEGMEKEFGKRVTDIVLGVTIPEAHEGEPHSWAADRTRYYHNLKDAPVESAIVAAADKIHNFGSILEDYADNTDKFRKDFNGTVEDRVHVYGAIVDVIVHRVPEGLARELKDVWEKYKNFVEANE